MDVTRIAAGRWALSRPVQDSAGGWSTVAAQQQLARSVRMYWPPLVAGAPAIDAVLVHGVGNLIAPPDSDTEVFPRDIVSTDLTLGDLTALQRQTWRDTLEAWLPGYSFTDYDGQVRNIPPFSTVTATYTLTTTLRQVARDIFKHFAHSTSRPRSSQPENHNTEYTDDFDTDPFASRWTIEVGNAAHDSGNGEVDFLLDTGCLLRYVANSPGSINQEAQCTSCGSGNAGDGVPGGAVRLANDGTNDGYSIGMNSGDTLAISRWNAGTRTDIMALSAATNSANFFSLRLAAMGVSGANVLLQGYQVDHGASKPSNPGWIGGAGFSISVLDTSVDRLDDGALHTQGGMGSSASGISEHDTRTDYWKVRAITDRTYVYIVDSNVGADTASSGDFMVAGNNRLVIAAGLDDASVADPGISAMTFNGSEALTDMTETHTTGTGDWIEVWKRTAPTGDVIADVDQTGGPAYFTIAAGFANVNQSTPTADVTIAESAGATSRSLSVPNVGAEDAVVAFINIGGPLTGIVADAGTAIMEQSGTAGAGTAMLLRYGNGNIGASGWASARCSIVGFRVVAASAGGSRFFLLVR